MKEEAVTVTHYQIEGFAWQLRVRSKHGWITWALYTAARKSQDIRKEDAEGEENKNVSSENKK